MDAIVLLPTSWFIQVFPSRHYLKATVQRKCKKIREHVETDVSSCDYIALTSDMWTALNMHALLGLIGHFINNKYSLHTKAFFKSQRPTLTVSHTEWKWCWNGTPRLDLCLESNIFAMLLPWWQVRCNQKTIELENSQASIIILFGCIFCSFKYRQMFYLILH